MLAQALPETVAIPTLVILPCGRTDFDTELTLIPAMVAKERLSETFMTASICAHVDISRVYETHSK